MKTNSFVQLFKEAKKQDAFWVADSIYTFTEELHRMAESGGVSRSELAHRLGTSPAYITKIFRGDVNFTVESMVRLARAVGGRLHLHLAPEQHGVRWFHIITSKKPAFFAAKKRPLQADKYKVYSKTIMDERHELAPAA